MGDEFNFYLKTSVKFLKKNWNWIILILLIFLGGYYRAYHLDYPVVGYHNWKEVHYLTEARNFARDGFFEYGFFIPYRDFWKIGDDSIGVHGDTFPTVSILSAIMFKIFGMKLWAARIVGFLFSIATILLIYLIIRRLSKNEILSLTGAALVAINPMFIFYSHNVQLINVGIFFAMLGVYLFLLWKNEPKPCFLIGSSMAFMLGAITKYPYLIVIASLIFLFPYKRLIKKKELKKYYIQYIISIIIFLAVPVWMMYAGGVAEDYGLSVTSADIGVIDLGKIFTSQFWQTARAYTADNFTLIGIIFAGLGFLTLLAMSLKKRNDLSKFLYGYLIGAIVFFIVMGVKLSGHSYHYFPIAPLIIILIAYFFTVIATSIAKVVKSLLKKKFVIPIITIIVILLLIFIVPTYSKSIYSKSIEAKDRQFNTQFMGLDVAGEYLRTRTAPGERIMHSSHQAYGVLWHGDVKGTRGIPKNVEDMVYAEEVLNITWIFMYNWDFGLLQGEVGQHIRENYHLAQVGFQQNNQQAVPTYFVFKKGGNFSEEQLNNFINSHPVQTKEYEYTFGKVPFFFVGE